MPGFIVTDGIHTLLHSPLNITLHYYGFSDIDTSIDISA